MSEMKEKHPIHFETTENKRNINVHAEIKPNVYIIYQ